MHTDTATRIDETLVHAAGVLRERADSLRVQAGQLTSPLQSAYRRRASELEFEAFLLEVQSGLPYEEIHTAA